MADFNEYLTVSEAAEILRVSPDTIGRRFENVPGVLNLGYPEKMRKRRYRLLRIPKSALHEFIQENETRGR